MIPNSRNSMQQQHQSYHSTIAATVFNCQSPSAVIRCSCWLKARAFHTCCCCKADDTYGDNKLQHKQLTVFARSSTALWELGIEVCFAYQQNCTNVAHLSQWCAIYLA